ncbi:MAG: 16S rRNA processing protein RimM [Acidobacteria bacterium]|nr:MAG: 16S rRNA processing protein RimM [Acidobacteriota bacterium]
MTLEWDAMVSVGRVARAHGNRGRVIVNPDSDFVEDRFRPGNVVYVRHGDRIDRLSIRDVRFHQHRPIVAFDEVVTMTEAEQLASAELRVPMETLERLPAGVFYHHELIGCRVETVEGAMVGTVSGVEGDGGVCRLVVEGGSAEILVPLVDAICVRIDLAAATITIEPPEGLLELNPPPRRRGGAGRRARFGRAAGSAGPGGEAEV